jgi:hypothetical protein
MDNLPRPDSAPVRAARSSRADPAKTRTEEPQDAADAYVSSDADIDYDAEQRTVQLDAKDTSLDDERKTQKGKDKRPAKAKAIEPDPVAVVTVPIVVPAPVVEGTATPGAATEMAMPVATIPPSGKPVPPSAVTSDPVVAPQTGESHAAADAALSQPPMRVASSHTESADGRLVSARVQEAIEAAPVHGQSGKVENSPAELKAVVEPQRSSKPVVNIVPLPVSKEAVAASDAAADFPPRAGEATALIQIANDRPGTTGRDTPAGDVIVNSKTGEQHDADVASVAVNSAPADDGKRKPVLPAIAAKLSSFANLVRGNRENQAIAPAMMPAVAKPGVVLASDTSTKVKEADSDPANSGLWQSAGRAADATPLSGGSMPSTILAAAPATGAAPAGVSAALGQQVVDMGISGRWIDDIARQIATVAANPGQGSFQLASQTLGAVRVDIMPGTSGSDIMMTVENEAAHAALSNDRQRLLQDAQIASVRLGDVQITRVASLADAQRGDMNSQNQGQGGSNGHAAQSALSQNPQGQGGQQARGDMGLNGQGAGGQGLGGQGQGGTKPQQSRVVLNDSAMARVAAGADGRADSARYA